MSESLLSLSEILLFGREVDDLRLPTQLAANFEARLATTDHLPALTGLIEVDGETVEVDDIILVRAQNNDTNNGLYKVLGTTDNPWQKQALVPRGQLVKVNEGTLAGLWEQKRPVPSGKQVFKFLGEQPGRRRGANRQLKDQLSEEGARFARIYGFAYEGTYYELPNPTLFLVHGKGINANELDGQENQPGTLFARAPNQPSLSGVAAADYQIANDIRVWTYDKADYTIRMDVASGMFEQVLLDLFFEVDLPMMAGAKVSGAKVSGAKVAGAKVAGAKVSGAKVAGAKVSGAKVGGFGD